MKIALAGTHSTGKTTLLKELGSRETFSDFSILPEITRSIKEKGFSINEQGTLDTQILIMNSHMENILYKDQFLVDRCLLDGWAYTTYLAMQSRVPRWFADYATNLLVTYMHRYDAVFYLPVEFGIEDDGVRSTDADFRKQVMELLEYKITEFSNVHLLQGSVGSRADHAEAIVRSLR
jgi:nicotinamide riboside kinase